MAIYTETKYREMVRELLDQAQRENIERIIKTYNVHGTTKVEWSEDNIGKIFIPQETGDYPNTFDELEEAGTTIKDLQLVATVTFEKTTDATVGDLTPETTAQVLAKFLRTERP